MDENEKSVRERFRREKKSSDLAMKIFPLLRKSHSSDQISCRSKTSLSHLFTHIKKITERNFTLS